MNDFDKELREALGKAFFAGRKSMELEMKSKRRAIQLPVNAHLKEPTGAIKQAVDKYVIGEDEEESSWNRAAHNELRVAERQSLWGKKL